MFSFGARDAGGSLLEGPSERERERARDAWWEGEVEAERVRESTGSQ